MRNQIKQDIPSNQPLPQTPPEVPPKPPSNWAKILLFTVLGGTIAGSVFLGIQIGKSQTPIQRQISVQPTALQNQITASASGLAIASSAANTTEYWKTYKNADFGIVFSYPPDVNSPYERNSLPNDSNKYTVVDFNTQCSGLSIAKYQSDKSLEDYIRYNFVKLTDANEWKNYENNFLQLANNKIQIGGKETINVGPMGIGETDNFFVKKDASTILLITSSEAVPEGMDSSEWKSHPCNINAAKEKETITQILSSFKFTN